MKKFQWILLVSVFAASVLMVSCGKKETAPVESSSESSVSQQETSSDSTSSTPAPESSSVSGESSSADSINIVLYHYETDSTEVVETEASDKPLDENILDTLNEHLGFEYSGQKYQIKLNSVTLENTVLTLDFTSDSLPLTALGSDQEHLYLMSIAESFLINYPEAEAVCLTVDGDIYSSGHFEFETDEPFMDRTMLS